MNRWATLSLVGLGIVLAPACATAQFYYYDFPARAATAAESYANGGANVIRAQGQRNLLNSQAAINYEEAYARSIDNRLRAVNAYWAVKDKYNERQSQKDYEIAQKRHDYLAKHGLRPLSPQEFDRLTGTILWPKVLEQSQYDVFRRQFDEVFRRRAYEGALTSADYVALRNASQNWRSLLASQKGVYPDPILTQMIRFVLSLQRDLSDNLG